MGAPIIFATIMVDMQIKNLAPLMYRLKIKSQSVDLFVFLQREPQVCFTIDHFGMHLHLG
ncbi:hypothetical protein D3C81_896580 [compost metagenome]